MSYNGLTDACSPIMFYRPDKEKNGSTPCLLDDRLLLLLLFVSICLLYQYPCEEKISPHGQKLDFLATALMTKQKRNFFFGCF